MRDDGFFPLQWPTEPPAITPWLPAPVTPEDLSPLADVTLGNVRLQRAVFLKQLGIETEENQ